MQGGADPSINSPPGRSTDEHLTVLATSGSKDAAQSMHHGGGSFHGNGRAGEWSEIDQLSHLRGYRNSLDAIEFRFLMK